MDYIDDVIRARAIVRRYARLRPSGKPIFCGPSRAELTGEIARKQAEGADGKVIYSDRAAAEAAARCFEAIYGTPMRAYACRRSRHGHYHLATDRARLNGGSAGDTTRSDLPRSWRTIAAS